MTKKKKILIFISAFLAVLLISLSAIIYFRDAITAKLLLTYMSRQLDSEVSAGKLCLQPGARIEISRLRITNNKGFNCNIEDTTLDVNAAALLERELSLDFLLEAVFLSYPESKIINNIAEALSISPLEVFSFDYIKGEFFAKGGETVFKKVHAKGSLIEVFADGSMREKALNWDVRLILSGKMISTIPESVRKVFFRQEGDSSEVKLYVTGSPDNPSINLSTDLFKLTVR